MEKLFAIKRRKIWSIGSHSTPAYLCQNTKGQIVWYRSAELHNHMESKVRLMNNDMTEFAIKQLLIGKGNREFYFIKEEYDETKVGTFPTTMKIQN